MKMYKVMAALKNGFTFTVDFIEANSKAQALKKAQATWIPYYEQYNGADISVALLKGDKDQAYFCKVQWEALQLFGEAFADLTSDEKVSTVDYIGEIA